MKNFNSKNNLCKLLHKPLIFSLVAFLLVGFQTQSQVTVTSLSNLMRYLDDDNVNVKLASGTYNISAADIDNGTYGQLLSGDIIGDQYSLFLFQGDNSTYDFTGVTINIDTEVLSAFGNNNFHELQIIGSNNVLTNLTMADSGDADNIPGRSATNIVMDGANNRIEGFHVTIKGSYPYGYGDIFGKGGGPVISHKKHSACLIRGNSNQVVNSTFIHRAYGHGIFFQGANDPYVEGCYVQGELSTVAAVLAEEGTGSPADDVDFLTVWGYKLDELDENYRFSLQEDGIRSYNAGETIIDGVEYDRGVTNATVIDCTVEKMRSGVTIGWASGTKYVENCTSLACESGYWVGADTEVVNSRGDASIGPLLSEDVRRSNSSIELTLLDNHVSKIGNTPAVYFAGSNHEVTINDGTTSFDSDIEFLIGGQRFGHRWLEGSGEEPPNFAAENISFNNQTNYPIILGVNSEDNDVISCGIVTDNGLNNNITNSTDCEITEEPTCSSITQPSNLVSGVTYNYYEGTWDILPDFNSLTPVATGVISDFNLDEASITDYFGFSFEGYIEVSSEGEYTFYTNSDDGSALWIDGEKVVDNDGLHGAIEESGTICLEAGYHKIEVAYFEQSGGNSLTVSYEGPSFSKTTISSLYTEDESTITNTEFVPDVNKTYYIDSAYHNARLAATGESEDAYTTDESTTGSDVEWKFVDKGNGYWHIQRAEGGTKPRLRTDVSENADMQETTSSGTYTYYEITMGDIEGSYFLTLPNGPSTYNRLQIDRNLDVKMVSSESHTGTWESFTITEVETATEMFLEAEDYDNMSGIQTENTEDTDGGENVGWINDGDWLRFDAVNLSGISNMDARMATSYEGGSIEVRTGSVSGTLIGSIDVSNTGGFQNWTTQNTNISTTSGTQDVYLIFTGGNGYLFNINWVEFNTSSQSNKEITLNESKLELYPNRATDSFQINGENIQCVEVYNVSGEVVKVFDEATGVYVIEGLITGVYIVKIRSTNGRLNIKKLIKL